MSRHESDREDLLREATALVQRAELRIAGNDGPVIVGFRAGGSASFFFGADPVYQFNAAGELRRGYVNGSLYKAERGQLIRLCRERGEAEVVLLRHELQPDEADALLSTARSHLAQLNEALATGAFIVIGEVPEGGDVVRRASQWLANVPAEIRVANAPGAR